MAWEWGVTGEKVGFQNFGVPQSNDSKQQYAWHCITIDPTLRYKWSPRSCVERKHYVCEVPAGRIGKIPFRCLEKKVNDTAVTSPSVSFQLQPEDVRKRRILTRRRTKD